MLFGPEFHHSLGDPAGLTIEVLGTTKILIGRKLCGALLIIYIIISGLPIKYPYRTRSCPLIKR